MGITALSGLEPEWFEPKQPGDDEKTAFLLKPLTGVEYMQVFMHMLADDEGVGLSERGVTNAIKFGLIGWRNFNNASGEAIPFSRANFDFINGMVLIAIAEKILEISEPSNNQKKT